MTTKNLINRLRDTASKGVSVWGDLQIEAAKEIETLLAERECYASAMDRMQAALARVDKPLEPSEPVAWLSEDSIGERYLSFDKPLDDYPMWPLFTHPAKPEPSEPDCSPNHLCNGRMVHLPNGEQCDKCGETP